MNSLKRLILILPIFLLLVLGSPLKVDAAKKVDYVDTKVFEGSGYEGGASMTVDKNNNQYITGYFQNTADFDFTDSVDSHTSSGSYDIFITKVNSNGTYGGTKRIGNSGDDGPNEIFSDNNNNIYVTGWFQNTIDFDPGGGIDNHTSNGGYDAFITKINADGTYEWTKTFGGTGSDWGNTIFIDELGNLYFGGVFESTVNFNFEGGTDNHTSNGNSDIFIMRLNLNGDYQSTITFGGTSWDSTFSLKADSSNNIYLSGYFSNTVDFNFTVGVDNHVSNGSGDIYVMKVNSNGSYGWTKTFGGAGFDICWDLELDDLGNIYITGNFEGTVNFNFTGGTDNHTSNGSNDLFLTKIYSDESYGWTKTLGSDSWESSYEISIDEFSNLYIAGYFRNTVDFDPGVGVTSKTISSFHEGFVSSFDKDGNFRFVKTQVSDSSQGSDIYALAYSSGKLYIAGDFAVTTDFNPDGPSDSKTTDSNYSAFLTTYQLYFPKVLVTESSGTTNIVPNVSTDTVTVKLDAEPDSNVTVTLGSNDGSLTYSPSSLTFTSATYAIAQTVTISSATPVEANTTKNMTFTLTSSDTDYNGLTVTPLIVGVLVDNSDVVAPGKVVITNLGNISNVPNKDILRYYFTSQTPTIKGTSEANSTVYFVVNGHTYSAVTGSDGKYTITLSNPSLERNKSVIVYYAKDSYFNKSSERTLELTVGEENFPVRSSSSSSSSSETSLSSSSSSSSSSSTSSVSSTSSSTSTSSIEVIETTKEITIKDENGNVLKNTVVTINGKTYTTDSRGKVKAEVAGVYVIEYDKGGVKYASTIKSSENIATLKKIDQPNYVIPILVVILLLIIGVFILLILLKKRNKSGENATF